jgi:hypothetical protein
MGWNFRRSHPGKILYTRTDRIWCLPTLVYNGYRVSSPGVKRPGRGFTTLPHLAPRLKKEYRNTSTCPVGLRGLFCGEIYLHVHIEYNVKN